MSRTLSYVGGAAPSQGGRGGSLALIGAVFALFAAFYLFYSLYLIVPSTSSLIRIVVAGCLYVMWFVVVSDKPAHSVFALLLLLLFFPKSGNDYVVISVDERLGVGLSGIVHSFAVIALCVRLIRHGGSPPSLRTPLGRLCVLAFLTAIVMFALAAIRQLQGTDPATGLMAPEEIVWPQRFIYGVAFLFGCIAFITEKRQVERCFKIFLLVGVFLSVESIAYIYLKLPLPYADRAIHVSGRYWSFIFADAQRLVLLSMAAIGCLIYFAFRRRRWLYLAGIPLLILPVIATYQRTPMVASVVTAATGTVLCAVQRRRLIWYAAVAVVGLVLYTSLPSDTIESGMTIFQGDVRPDYFDKFIDSGASRLGAWARGLDTIVYSFPFGVGPGRLNYVMSSVVVPQRFGSDALPDSAALFYAKIASAEHETGPHNAIISFVAEFGVFGLATLLAGMSLMFTSLGGVVGARGRASPELALMRRASLAILFGIGFNGLSQSEEFYYLSFFLMFVSAFPVWQLADVKQIPVPRFSHRRRGVVGIGRRLAS